MVQPNTKRLVTHAALEARILQLPGGSQQVSSADLALKAPLISPTFSGVVTGVSRSMVGLGAVNNTADVDKPVSTAMQTALNGKANVGEVGSGVGSGVDSVKTPSAWVNGKAYVVGDYFSTSGIVYRVIAAHTAGATAPTAAGANFVVWGSSAMFPDSVVIRNGLNEATFSTVYVNATPTASNAATSKQYVDQQIGSIASPPAAAFGFFLIIWNGVAWTYGNAVITARPSAMRSGDRCFFDGLGPLPTWVAPSDLMTEG